MDRNKRRQHLLRERKAGEVSSERLYQESATRNRIARKARYHLRRLEPVAIIAPRWSAPASFLETLSMDLAGGEPALHCRTLSVRSMLGRPIQEVRNFLLRGLGDLPGLSYENRPLPMAVDRRGFLYAAGQILEELHAEDDYVGEEPNEQRTALLLHGVENLPVEVLEDLGEIWREHVTTLGARRRFTLLLCGSIDTPALDVGDAVRIELSDYADTEAAAQIALQVRVPSAPLLERIVRYSGGVPAVVEALVAGANEQQALPEQPVECLRLMGGVGDEFRGAVQAALALPDTAERIYSLLDGGAHQEQPNVDQTLLYAGLVRRVRALGQPQIRLRSPALVAAAI